MYCVIKCIVRGNHAHIKNADLRHPSCTVVMYRHKSASPVHNVLIRGKNVLNFACGKVVGRDCIVGINSVALVRERTIPTERPPPVGEVSANFCG